jgi:ketosteroid isomerase-like protein
MASDDRTEATRARTLRLYGDYTRGDMAAVMAGIAEDIAWSSVGEGLAPWSGRWSGKDGVAAYFAAVQAACEVTAYDIEHVIAEGDWATVLGTIRIRYRGDGSERQYAKADILRFGQGLLVEFREFYDTAGMLQDLGRVNTASSDRSTP